MSGQEQISCDLLSLSKVLFERNPSIKANTYLLDQVIADEQAALSVFDGSIRARLFYNRSQENLFQADPRYTTLGDQLRVNTSGFSSTYQKLLRSGQTISVGVDYSQVSDNYPLNRFNEAVGEYIGDHNASATLSFSQPLLRARGKDNTLAQVNAAEKGVERTEAELTHANTAQAYNLVVAYWRYLGAFRNYDIYIENEDRVKRIYQITAELVEGNKRARTDLIQINADLAEKESQRIQAYQSLVNARLNLGTILGLSEEESYQIGEPIDDFPSVQSSGFYDSLSVEQLARLAIANRQDMVAYKKTYEELSIQLDLLENKLLPELNLNLSGSYGGAYLGHGLRGFTKSFVTSEGRNYLIGASIDFRIPVKNIAAKANLLKGRALLANQQINVDNLERTLCINVISAYNDIEGSAMSLKQAKESLGYYQQVFRNEKIKFRNGMATILDLILFQERLTFAELNYIQTKLQFALAISRLRFETGTLIKVENGAVLPPSDLSSFYEIPIFNQ